MNKASEIIEECIDFVEYKLGVIELPLSMNLLLSKLIRLKQLTDWTETESKEPRENIKCLVKFPCGFNDKYEYVYDYVEATYENERGYWHPVAEHRNSFHGEIFYEDTFYKELE